MMLLWYIMLNIISCYTCYAEIKPWTWLYKINNLSSQPKLKSHECVVVKEDVPLFSQLIFSWNAQRPAKGYFSFWAQVRDPMSKIWHDWHHMMDWGADIQRSYKNDSLHTSYHHVRLEIPLDKLADGLRIKIKACEGAAIQLLHSIAVNIANFNAFESEDNLTVYAHSLPSFHISQVPQFSQMILDHPKNTVLCSPTSCAMMLSYLMKQPIDPLDIARGVYDDGLSAYGSWPFNTAYAFEQSHQQFFFRVVRLESFEALYKKLRENIPVIVSVRGPLQGAAQPYNNGHLLVVVGWDQKKRKVLCHDPAFDTVEHVFTSYDISSFCQAWERSRRLAYIAEKVPVS